MVARLVWDQDAAGSNPVTSTTENLEKWLYEAKFQGFFFVCYISLQELKYAFLRCFTRKV